MKKTIEEVAEEYAKDFDLSFYDTVEEIPVKEHAVRDFLAGAEHQSEQMYSHEEVNQYIQEVMSGLLKLSIKEWRKESKI